LRQICGDLYRAILYGSLDIVARRKLQQYSEGALAGARRRERRLVRRIGSLLSPDPLDQGRCGLPELHAGRARFRTVLREQLIKKDYVSGQVLHVRPLGLK